jgi:hypothetical protein
MKPTYPMMFAKIGMKTPLIWYYFLRLGWKPPNLILFPKIGMKTTYATLFAISGVNMGTERDYVWWTNNMP